MTKNREEDETAIKKPIARRPGFSHHKSFSELFSDAVEDSSPADVSETAVVAIRPKTVRFKPTRKVITSFKALYFCCRLCNFFICIVLVVLVSMNPGGRIGPKVKCYVKYGIQTNC